MDVDGEEDQATSKLLIAFRSVSNSQSQMVNAWRMHSLAIYWWSLIIRPRSRAFLNGTDLGNRLCIKRGLIILDMECKCEY